MKKFFLLFWLLAPFFSALAQEGTLDPTFGNNGLVGIGKEFIRQTFSDDGKLVGAITENGLIKLYRYNNDGSPDASFGTDGVVVVDSVENHPNPIFTETNTIHDVAVDHQGKIVLAILFKYSTGVPVTDYIVRRFNSNGSIDNTFGTNGETAAIDSDSPFTPVAFGPMSIQNDNKIVVATARIARVGYPHYLNVYRIANDGTLDLRWASPASNEVDFYPIAIAIQSNGKIVVEARKTTSPGSLVLFRLTNSGAIDVNFGENGQLTLNLSPYHPSYDGTRDMVLQSDGKIIIKHGLSDSYALSRFNEDGTPDPSFGTNGMAILKPGFWAETMKILNNDKILIGGVSRGDTKETFDQRNLTLQRLNQNGTPDAFFGNSGKGMTVLRLFSVVQSIGIYANRIYTYGVGGVLGAFRLATSSPVTVLPRFAKTVFTKDGKLVGIITEDKLNKIYRYNPDGTPDATFGSGGVVVIDSVEIQNKVIPLPGYKNTNSLYDIAIDNKMRIVVAEIFLNYFSAGTYSRSYRLTRFDSNGNLDNSFGSNGSADEIYSHRVDNPSIPIFHFGQMAIQSDNKPVLTYGYWIRTIYKDQTALLRLNEDGTPDRSFNSNSNVSSLSTGYLPSALVIQRNGRIVVQLSDGRLLGVSATGTVDPSFGIGKGFSSSFGAGLIAVLSDDAILVVRNGFKSMVKTTPDGFFDLSFNIVNLPFDVNKIEIGAIRQFYLGGMLNGDFALARYNDSQKDPTFGNDGIISTDFGGSEGIENMVLVGKTMYVYGNGILTSYFIGDCTPPIFLNDGTIVLDASCTGNDGNISIIPTKGIPPFAYSIDEGATYVSGADGGHTFQGLAPGTYQLRLKDANGCESAVVTREVRKFYGGPLFKNDGTIVLDASCGANDGNISIIPTCGAAPFQYSIDGGMTYVEGPATGYTFQNLAPGTYQLRLKDAYGTESAIVTRQVRPDFYGPCATVTAAGPGARTAQAKETTATLRVYPNPSKGQFMVQLSGVTGTVQIMLLDSKGMIVAQKNISAKDGNRTEFNLSNKAKGLYLIKVVREKDVILTKVMIQ